MSKTKKTNKELSSKQKEQLLNILKTRFDKNINLHKELKWEKISAKLEANPEKLWSLNEMERTGGEPDVVGYDKKTGEFIFYDCSAESPAGRRSFCYDRTAFKLGEFDLKTSSWVKTPDNIRKLGGAIFCDRRYNNVFTYHNGAESYYAARGFRGVLKV
ncbi:MAG: DUF4256 domain-containing protein [Ignavibacterium sp.]|nr:DUF4256 domain-containing protein [Ignavibacterium sp.]